VSPTSNVLGGSVISDPAMLVLIILRNLILF